jgi:DNA modification methylase
MSYDTQTPNGIEQNKLYQEDRAFHDWYRFVLSYPPHLVRHYLEKFGIEPGQVVLDPFCGTGTTLVEAKKLGVCGLGTEANPMAQFAAATKLQWGLDGEALVTHSAQIAQEAQLRIERHRGELKCLTPDQEKLLIRDSISPIPLHKALILLEVIEDFYRDLGGDLYEDFHGDLTGDLAGDLTGNLDIDVYGDSPHDRQPTQFYNLQRLALAKQIVFACSNLHFGPEVGISRHKKTDAPVVEVWWQQVQQMAEDLHQINLHAESYNQGNSHQGNLHKSDLHQGNSHQGNSDPKPDRSRPWSRVYLADAREISRLENLPRVDRVITSPPYPNEKDYTRTTRLESVLLGFLTEKADLRHNKQRLLRSNSRNIYKGDRDDIYIAHSDQVLALAEQIEAKRIALGKTSGFEKMYGQVVKNYFGGMVRHLQELQPILKPGAKLAYVVGDQASYFQIPIRTGQILADLAQQAGYQVIGIDLFRTRLSTVTKEWLREEVVLLQWP